MRIFKKLSVVLALTLLCLVSYSLLKPAHSFAVEESTNNLMMALTVHVSGPIPSGGLQVTATRPATGANYQNTYTLNKLNSDTYGTNQIQPFYNGSPTCPTVESNAENDPTDSKLLVFGITVKDSTGTVLTTHAATTYKCGNNDINVTVTGSKPTPSAQKVSINGTVYICQTGTTTGSTCSGTLDVASNYTDTDGTEETAVTINPTNQTSALNEGGGYYIQNLTPGNYTLSGFVADPTTPGIGYSFSNLHVTLTTASGGVNTKTIVINGTTGTATATNSTPTATGGSSGPTATTCVAQGGPFSWFICAAITSIQDTENAIINDFVQPLLATPITDFSAPATCPASDSAQQCNEEKVSITTYQIWSNFRIFGDILLVIAVLIVVFAETIGGGSIEAFSAKKMLPRILAAAVLINLSIYIVVGLEDIVNILGHGIRDLIQVPFQPLAGSVKISGPTGVIASLGAAGALAAVGFTEGVAGIALFILGGFLLAAIGVLVTLMIRQALLVILVLVSPVAFALYCLPNTEQYFRKYFDLLIKTLLVYPIVMIVIAMSNVAYVVVTNFNIGGATIIKQLMGILAAVAPLFLIPFAFKISGGAMAQIANGVDSIRQKAKAPIDNLRSANRKDRLERARNGKLFRGGETGFGARMNRRAQTVMLANKAGLRPGKMRENIASARSEVENKELEHERNENESYAVWKADDDMNRAATESNNEAELRANLLAADKRRVDNGGEARFADPLAMNEAVSRIQRTRRSMSNEAFKRMTALGALAGGTAYDTADEAWAAVAAAAGNDDAALSNMVGIGRRELMQAGRVDQGGASFGTTRDATIKMRNELRSGGISDQTKAEVNKRIYGSSADSSSPATAIYGKPISAQHLAETHKQNLEGLVSSLSNHQAMNINGETRVATEADITQAMATSAGVYDAMSQAAPNNAREYAKALTGGAPLDLSGVSPELRNKMLGPNTAATGETRVSVLEGMDNLRGNDQAFAESRRDLGTQFGREADYLQQQQMLRIQQSQPGAPPPGIPGGPPSQPLNFS